MSSELPLLATHQPTWHTPTTEPSKGLTHGPLFNLQQMLGSERPFPRHSPGVDLSLTRNGNQNGDLPQTPISLSVRDAKQINSLPPSALDGTDRAVELTKVASPGLQESQQPSPKSIRKPAKRVDSILERLNTTSASEKTPQSVIVTAASSSHDENSNSSAGTGTTGSLPATVVAREDEVVSPASNEDSLDSNKSRRKRKPSKTVKVSKDDETPESPEKEQTEGPVEREIEAEPVQDPLAISEPAKEPENEPEPCQPEPEPEEVEEVTPSPTRRRSSSEPPGTPPSINKSRRKTVSESETIDNIAAMVAATEVPVISEPVKEITEIPPELPADDEIEKEEEDIPVAKPVSVITRDHSTCSGDSLHSLSDDTPIIHMNEESIEKVDIPVPPMLTAAQKKGDNQCFVAVEDELEKMFAGIADADDKIDTPLTDPLALPSTSQSSQNTIESVTSTSNEIASTSLKISHKRGRPKGSSKNNSRRPSESNSTESTPRKKHKANKKLDEHEEFMTRKVTNKTKKGKKIQSKQQVSSKADVVKDVYSYDSGSNASSSRSRGPFIQIRGPRDSPISVSIVNAPSNDDDPEKPGKQTKNKKFHDDSEYRHKVRSKGLHCSTLSNKYDAQTRDASWICVFCKRGPHATDPQLPGPSPYTLDMPQYSPGDLFGPYVISTECPEYQRRVDDPYDTQFKSKRAASVAANVANELSRSGKKNKKRLNSETNRDSLDSTDANRDSMLGIAEVTSNSYEVWVHEDCVTWAPGVYLVGPKIVGLEGAVWGACSVACKYCGLRGAAVCCLKRGCGTVMHIGCAKLSKWKLDEQNYKAYCTEHKMP